MAHPAPVAVEYRAETIEPDGRLGSFDGVATGPPRDTRMIRASRPAGHATAAARRGRDRSGPTRLAAFPAS